MRKKWKKPLIFNLQTSNQCPIRLTWEAGTSYQLCWRCPAWRIRNGRLGFDTVSRFRNFRYHLTQQVTYNKLAWLERLVIGKKFELRENSTRTSFTQLDKILNIGKSVLRATSEVFGAGLRGVHWFYVFDYKNPVRIIHSFELIPFNCRYWVFV